jgi:cobalt-zinc-cadmium efflux system membrane fusion protein
MNHSSRALATCMLLHAGAAMAAQPLGCLIEPFRVADVGSPVIGVIETLHAERGDRVVRGQPLATLRADVERASVSVATARAQAVGELQAAQANAELARQKLERARDLANRQFISSQALEQARAEALVADNRLAQAKEQRDVLARENELARAQLGLRTIRSPSAGVIAERYLSAGERVEEKAVFRVAVIDPLRVEVVLPASLYASVHKGMSMTVTPEFPGAQPRRAKVTVVDKLIDGASNTFRARLELPNADQALPAGLRCKADLGGAIPARAGAPVQGGSTTGLRMSPSLTLPAATKP